MTADVPALPVAPRIRPLGPLIRAAELKVWHDAVQALAAAERHLQRVRSWGRKAYELERMRGHAEGKKTGAEEMTRLIAQAVCELAQRKAALDQELPQLVIEIVSNLLGAFEPSEMLVRAVRHAIEQKYKNTEVCLHVSPLKADLLASEFAAYDGLDDRPKVRIQPDPALTADQCVLWSEFGNVDLGLAAQVRALRLGLGLSSQEGEP
ncbi:type III secretion system stator protein SctL [Bradyrhizobium septentrionale]|uniref:Type 3 secretion system stator protein n=1 Tax=Bradyrhizobium septentrionale TaxID=1404411 RepID=A0A973VW17_9BRAD|nr:MULTISPECIES: type III secretion system stator protein SctL [Bradyrhizobium]MCK7672654.1 type III secretion system stator protein SctL [Bradyrhizobium sp. 2S1]UGY20328.1 type III secretion system stator protein SctL [Bradyrhizobium septentrionale]UGY29155.1 type III secretion system stator protein SctL [Bradyrhizobium septentrionale]